ncbi:MAG: hypothetical protein EON59_01315 [Alphaproteobacteria bacterium]|nr:MAG: hypothetical protein EON59_01315 [Alphaproteobacteria bacterium]
MKPLAFTLPPLVQVSWASPTLRQRWGEVFAGAPLALAQRWIDAIGRRELPAAIFPVRPFDLPILMRAALAFGLEVRPLDDSHRFLGRMGWRAPALSLVVAAGCTTVVDAIVERLGEADEAGFLMEAGWPKCCATARASSGAASPIWAFIRSTEASAQPVGAKPLSWHPLLRTLGINLLPHVPCGPDCAPSIRHAQRLASTEEVDEVLSWSVNWSALHGLTEIFLPVSKILHDIDPTADTHRFVLAGDLPEETPFGLVAPYREPSRRPLRTTKSFQRGIATPRENPLPRVPPLARVAQPLPRSLPPEPAILEGVAEGWPAMEKWTLPNLARRFGKREIKLHRDEATRQSCFVDFAAALQREEGENWYLVDFGFERDAPDMLADFTLPDCLRSWHDDLPLAERPALLSLYIGGPGSGVPVHFDLLYTCGFNTLFSGRKHWYFCPPSTLAEWFEPTADLFDPDVRDKLRLKGLRLYEHIQSPGETLFVPSGWWHQTRVLETSIALTGNIVNSWNAEKVREAARSAEHPVLRKIGAMLIRSIEASE